MCVSAKAPGKVQTSTIRDKVSTIQWHKQTCTQMMAVQSHCSLSFLPPSTRKTEIFVMKEGEGGRETVKVMETEVDEERRRESLSSPGKQRGLGETECCLLGGNSTRNPLTMACTMLLFKAFWV